MGTAAGTAAAGTIAIRIFGAITPIGLLTVGMAPIALARFKARACLVALVIVAVDIGAVTFARVIAGPTETGVVITVRAVAVAATLWITRIGAAVGVAGITTAVGIAGIRTTFRETWVAVTRIAFAGITAIADAWVVACAFRIARIIIAGVVAQAPGADDGEQIGDVDQTIAIRSRRAVAGGARRSGFVPVADDFKKVKYIGGRIAVDVRWAFRQGIKALVGPLDAFDPELSISGVTGTESPEADDVDLTDLNVEFQM